MTTRTSTSASGPERSRKGLWIALAALLVGVVVAVLGVRAAVDSYQRDRDLASYHDARATATYFTRNGVTISAAMKRLQTLDRRDVALMKAQHQALDANDASQFNALADSANSRSQQQQALRNQLKRYQSALTEAQNR